MASRVQEFHQTQATIIELQKRLEELKPKVEEEMALIDLVKSEIEKHGFNPRDIALAIYPALGKGLDQSQQTKTVGTRRARTLKVYLNPHTNERVETKGGNHKVLKAWKQKHGGDTVESWLQQ